MQRSAQDLLLCLDKVHLGLDDQVQNGPHQIRVSNRVSTEVADAAQLGTHCERSHDSVRVHLVAGRAVLHHVFQLLQRNAHIVVAVRITRFDCQYIIQFLNLSGRYGNIAVFVKTHFSAQSAALSNCAGVGSKIAAAVQQLKRLQLGIEHHLWIMEILIQGHLRHRVKEGICVVVEYCMAIRLLSGDALSQPFCVSFFQSRHNQFPFFCVGGSASSCFT